MHEKLENLFFLSIIFNWEHINNGIFYFLTGMYHFFNFYGMQIGFLYMRSYKENILWEVAIARNIWKIFPLVPSKIYKVRQVCLSQFVYCLREVCLLINFWMIKFTIMFFWKEIFPTLWIFKTENSNKCSHGYNEVKTPIDLDSLNHKKSNLGKSLGSLSLYGSDLGC